MSYLDKVKRLKTQKLSDTTDLESAKKAKYAKEGLQTVETPFGELRNKLDTLPGLPWQLERLICAASSDLLPKGALQLSGGFVLDLNRYVMAWGCSYLTGNRNEALSRLWQAYRAWRGVN